MLAEFDFRTIADVTGHPYRVQCEQSRLTRILFDQLRSHPDFAIRFDSPVRGVTQTAPAWRSWSAHAGRTHAGSLADRRRRGAQRRAPGLGIGFEGFTWPERFLVVSTPFDFSQVIPTWSR